MQLDQTLLLFFAFKHRRIQRRKAEQRREKWKRIFQEILRRFTFSFASVNIAFRSYDACASERKRVFDSDACDFSSSYNYRRSRREAEAKWDGDWITQEFLFPQQMALALNHGFFWLDMNISSLSSTPVGELLSANFPLSPFPPKREGAKHEATQQQRNLHENWIFFAFEKFTDESQGEKSNLWHIKSTNSQTSSQQHLVSICINA